jgi:Phosphate-selective porin O and P
MKPEERSNAKRFSEKFSRYNTASSIISLALLAAAQSAQSAELKLGEDAGLTAGIGLRTSYTSTKNGAPNGTSRSNDFNVENARLFLTGHYKNTIKATFNTERNPNTDSIRVLDAFVQFEPMPEFNIWAGRLLPPQDRANGYGPFYALPWSYPGIVSGYPQIENGRDNGVMVWGKPFGGKMTYSFGAFEGHNKATGYSAQKDKLAFSGRLVAHLLEPEPAPAHLAGGWFGGKDLLSIGIAGYTQTHGVGSQARPGLLQIWNADLLFEKKLAFGVPNIELAYYKYKLNVLDCDSGEPGAPTGCTAPGATTPANSGGMADGKAILIGGGFLFPQKVGWGQFQPFVRYQKFDRSVSNTSVKATDFGVNYLISGPKAKITAMYTKGDDTRLAAGRQDTNQFTLGVQLMY